MRGFNNPFRVEYNVINLDTLAQMDTDQVTPETLRERGLVHKHGLVKVLGRGDLGGKAVQVKAHAFSKTAEAAILAAGGSTERLPMPFGNGRPPGVGQPVRQPLSQGARRTT